MSIFAKMGEAAKKFMTPMQRNPEMITPYQKALTQQPQNKPMLLSDEAPKPQGQKEVHFLNPALDEHRDISRDKRGNYVQTLTYPLPPLKWEDKQNAKNRRMRNAKNRFLD